MLQLELNRLADVASRHLSLLAGHHLYRSGTARCTHVTCLNGRTRLLPRPWPIPLATLRLSPVRETIIQTDSSAQHQSTISSLTKLNYLLFIWFARCHFRVTPPGKILSDFLTYPLRCHLVLFSRTRLHATLHNSRRYSPRPLPVVLSGLGVWVGLGIIS